MAHWLPFWSPYPGLQVWQLEVPVQLEQGSGQANLSEYKTTKKKNTLAILTREEGACRACGTLSVILKSISTLTGDTDCIAGTGLTSVWAS